MTDLTEQWKKGELQERAYYILLTTGEVLLDLFNTNGYFEKYEELVEQVLAEVPSYEQWHASENYIDYLKQYISVYESKEKQHTDDAIAYNELAEENEKLKSKLQIKETVYDFDTARLEEENTKLKELLKQAYPLFNYKDVSARTEFEKEWLAKAKKILGEE